jgi:DNA-binding MarR family transcriptional regulator
MGEQSWPPRLNIIAPKLPSARGERGKETLQEATALSRANRNDKSTLTSALTGLVQKKLVNRQRAEGDKRIYRLTVTPAGERLLQRLTECAKQHDRNLTQVIGQRDYAHFMQILLKIAAELG